MFYNDHDPPHIHIEYQEYDATISIEDGIVNGEVPRRALKLVYEWLDLHRTELLANWELAQEHMPLNKVAPLK